MGPRLISLGVAQMNNSQVVFYLPDKSAGCHGSIKKTYFEFQSIQFYKRNGGRTPSRDRYEAMYQSIGQKTAMEYRVSVGKELFVLLTCINLLLSG